MTVKRAITAKETQPKVSAPAVNKARPKSSLFEKDPHSFYLTFDTNGFFRDMKISCVLLLRNIVNSQVDREFIKKDIEKEVQKIGKVARLAQKDKNIYIEF